MSSGAGEPAYFPRRRPCAPGTLAGPAARPPKTAVDPAAWPLQHMSAHRIIIIRVHFVIKDMRTACAELRARAGAQPRKMPNVVEEGNDDCGDDKRFRMWCLLQLAELHLRWLHAESLR
eukprot:7488097-Pyramimonas_sp.AAC.1